MSLRLTAAQRRVLLDALTSPDGGLHSQTPMAGLFTSAQHRDRFYQGSTIRCLVGGLCVECPSPSPSRRCPACRRRERERERGSSRR